MSYLQWPDALGTTYQRTTISNGGAGYTAGATSIVVASGAVFPANGDFYVGVRPTATDLTPTFTKLCTARTGNTLTVAAGATDGTDTNMSDGAIVEWVLNGAALNQFIADRDRVLTAAQFAALASHGYRNGDTVTLSDCLYRYVRSGSLWKAFYGQYPAVPPPTSGWSAINSATVTQSPGGRLRLQVPNNASFNLRAYTRAVASAPYTVTVKFFLNVPGDLSSRTMGICLSNGTAFIGLEILTQSSARIIRVQRITNVTTDGSTTASSASILTLYDPRNQLLIFKIQNDDTNHIFSYSLDGGDTFTTLLTEAKGAYITPTTFGIGGNNITSTASGLTGDFCSWDVQ